jgi:hypothetical protein
MIEYKCFELHNHTRNSDGQFTTEELCVNAKKNRYDGIAITDHNTMSAMDDLTPELLARTLPVIPGIEWTTFFGHMVVLGADSYIDWRFARPDDIDTYIEKIKAVHGVVGIAHPFNVGSPLCTGCYWDFKVQNWNNVDYIEVWSEPFPHAHFKNALAFQWWTSLLNQGHKIAAAAGRDWHGLDKGRDLLTTATYLGLRDGLISAAAVKDALSAGRSFVTCGPVLDITVSNGDGSHGLGETIKAGEYTLNLSLDETKRRDVWERFGVRTRSIRLVQNGEPVQTIPCDGSYQGTCAVNLSPGWFRVEGYGQYVKEDNKLLTFSSPIYIHK